MLCSSQKECIVLPAIALRSTSTYLGFFLNFQPVHSSIGTVEYPFTLAKAKTILIQVLVGFT